MQMTCNEQNNIDCTKDIDKNQNVLVLDTSTNKVCVAAKTAQNSICIFNESVQRQSQKLLPLIDFALQQVGLSPKDLCYTALSLGPGSFTGLRLGLSCLKALTLAYNTPCYGVCTLDLFCYLAQKKTTQKQAQFLSVLDAHKNRFYSKIYTNTTKKNTFVPTDILNTDILDAEAKDIYKKIDKNAPLVICGGDSLAFFGALKQLDKDINAKCITQIDIPKALFEIAQDMWQNNTPALKDFQGALYARSATTTPVQ